MYVHVTELTRRDRMYGPSQSDVGMGSAANREQLYIMYRPRAECWPNNKV